MACFHTNNPNNPDLIVKEAIKILYGQLRKKPILNTSKRVANFLWLKYGKLDFEQFGVLALNSKLQLLEEISLFRGTVDQCPVYPKELFRKLLLSGPVRGFIAYHNHPGGKANPSSIDIEMTKRLRMAGDLLDMQLLDHVIVSETGYYSFADDGHKALLK